MHNMARISWINRMQQALNLVYAYPKSKSMMLHGDLKNFNFYCLSYNFFFVVYVKIQLLFTCNRSICDFLKEYLFNDNLDTIYFACEFLFFKYIILNFELPHLFLITAKFFFVLFEKIGTSIAWLNFPNQCQSSKYIFHHKFFLCTKLVLLRTKILEQSNIFKKCFLF